MKDRWVCGGKAVKFVSCNASSFSYNSSPHYSPKSNLT